MRVVIALTYLLLVRDALAWTGRALLEPEARVSLVVVAVLAVSVLRRTHAGVPEPPASALLVTLGAALAYGVLARHLPIDRLLVAVAALGAWGVLGSFVALSWRSLAVAALFVAALPHAALLDTYVGFPLRLLTVELAQAILAGLGHGSVSRETILVFDRGAAQIDLPCSGVRSLWAGLLLALSTPLVAGRRFGARWLALTLGLAAALVAGNTLRIVVLVALTRVAPPLLVELVHQPLGLVAFTAAALLFVRSSRALPEATSTPRATPARPSLRAATACAMVLACAAPAPLAAAPTPLRSSLTLPLPFATTPAPLSPMEARFFATQGARLASKHRFTHAGIGGSFIVVEADTLRAQHAPETCLTASGHEVRDSETRLIDGVFPVRVLSLQGPARAAVYWFQSASRTTEDYSARVWSPGRWVQVSIALDTSAEALPLDVIRALHGAVAAVFFAGGQS